MPEAILFGSIGTIVETSDIQREAFNQAFAEAKLGWFWGPDLYAELLQSSGGEARIHNYALRRGETVDATAVHARKSEIFQAKLREGIDARPGVGNVVAAAHRQGVPLAFCTTTSQENVRETLSAAGLSADDFAFVGHSGLVANSKPDPEIFRLALKTLGVPASAALAIEDSSVSARAARSAGLPTIGFPGRYHTHDDWGDVLSVVGTLSLSEVELREDQAA